MNLMKNSSGRIIGVSYIDKHKIIIDNYSKPFLQINDEQLINKISANQDEGVIELFDNHKLLIGEIASLYGVPYHVMNRRIIDLRKIGLIKTEAKSGRRNSSFGKTFSEERRFHIGGAGKGIHSHDSPYVMTDEIRRKISKTLLDGHSTGRIVVNRAALSQAWKNGKYDNAEMGRGIQGFFESNKHTKCKDVYFRSLLELKFLIQIEEDSSVKSFTWEPICIPIDNKSHYTPDCLIDNVLIELKPRTHLIYTKDGVNHRFEREVQSANKYCREHGLVFRIIYDDELNFVSKDFRKYLLDNPDIIEKYNIRFKKGLRRN